MSSTSRSGSPAGGCPSITRARCGPRSWKTLPWLEDEPEAGIHSIHGAASGNGWERPGGGSGGMLNLSRRTRLVLRVPVSRAGETAALCGRRLDVGGCELTTGERQPRWLKPAGAVFARYVVDEEGGDEERFVERVVSELRARSVTARKLLCGRSHRIESDQGMHATRSLLVADLGRDESLALQCRGIGPGRLLGCGLFVPHKGRGPRPENGRCVIRHMAIPAQHPEPADPSGGWSMMRDSSRHGSAAGGQRRIRGRRGARRAGGRSARGRPSRAADSHEEPR